MLASRSRSNIPCLRADLCSQNSATGTRTRVARVRAEYPNQLDYSGCCITNILIPPNKGTPTYLGDVLCKKGALETRRRLCKTVNGFSHLSSNPSSGDLNSPWVLQLRSTTARVRLTTFPFSPQARQARLATLQPRLRPFQVCLRPFKLVWGTPPTSHRSRPKSFTDPSSSSGNLPRSPTNPSG